jgi:enoyl-CoA hydratase/carnithine racemase
MDQQVERRKAVLLSHLQSSQLETSTTSSKTSQNVVSSTLTNDGVSIIYFNNPPVNACSNELLQGLETELNSALKNDNCKSIVLASQIKRFFVAGADISVIQKLQGFFKFILK